MTIIYELRASYYMEVVATHDDHDFDDIANMDLSRATSLNVTLAGAKRAAQVALDQYVDDQNELFGEDDSGDSLKHSECKLGRWTKRTVLYGPNKGRHYWETGIDNVVQFNIYESVLAD